MFKKETKYLKNLFYHFVTRLNPILMSSRGAFGPKNYPSIWPNKFCRYLYTVEGTPYQWLSYICDHRLLSIKGFFFNSTSFIFQDSPNNLQFCSLQVVPVWTFWWAPENQWWQSQQPGGTRAGMNPSLQPGLEWRNSLWHLFLYYHFWRTDTMANIKTITKHQNMMYQLLFHSRNHE